MGGKLYDFFVLLSIYLFPYFVQVGTNDLNVAGDVLEGPRTLLAMRAANSLSSKCFDIYFFFNFQKEIVFLR